MTMTMTDDNKFLEAAHTAGLDLEQVIKFRRALSALSAPAPHEVAQTAPAEASAARVAARKPHRRGLSDGEKYVDSHLAPIIRQSPEKRIIGTTADFLTLAAWPFGGTTPGAGRSMGALFGRLFKMKRETAAGVFVVSEEGVSAPGKKSLVRYTLGIRKGR